jgi:hypothetical protein
MPSFHDDRGGIVHEAVQTLIPDKRPLMQMAGYKAVAFLAIVFSLWAHTVKFGADILPACPAQDVTADIEYGIEHPGYFIKWEHQFLQVLNVYKVRELIVHS